MFGNNAGCHEMACHSYLTSYMGSSQFWVKPYQPKMDSPVLLAAENPRGETEALHNGPLTQITESWEDSTCVLSSLPSPTLPKHQEVNAIPTSVGTVGAYRL